MQVKTDEHVFEKNTCSSAFVCEQLPHLRRISEDEGHIDEVVPDFTTPETHTQAGAAPTVSTHYRLPEGVVQGIAPLLQVSPTAAEHLPGDGVTLGRSGPRGSHQ
jgi:hypothetical protein